MTPVLVTLTAPSCSGKSYLLNYIRDVKKIPCLVSTTTRAPRAGEQEGVDYYFISHAESCKLENEDKFAELAIYNGTRYGVTKDEFKSKLDTGLTFLIVEPTGIDHYVKPALDVGAKHFKVFIDTSYETRMHRFFKRFVNDLDKLITNFQLTTFEIANCVKVNNSRFDAISEQEKHWKGLHQWDLILDGTIDPEINLNKILTSIKEKFND